MISLNEKREKKKTFDVRKEKKCLFHEVQLQIDKIKSIDTKSKFKNKLNEGRQQTTKSKNNTHYHHFRRINFDV